jgi:hypothetical protein
MLPIARPPGETDPVRVEVIQVPGPKKDAGWWITTVGSVFIPALALAVAFVALLDQHGAEQAAQAAAARTYASQVSFFQDPPGSPAFKIENSASAPIHSVLLQSAVHQHLDSLGTLPPCMTFTVNLPPASSPVIYFRDANGIGWELPLGGVAQPSVDPSAILAVLPLSAVSSLSRADLNPQPVPGCS